MRVATAAVVGTGVMLVLTASWGIDQKVGLFEPPRDAFTPTGVSAPVELTSDPPHGLTVEGDGMVCSELRAPKGKLTAEVTGGRLENSTSRPIVYEYTFTVLAGDTTVSDKGRYMSNAQHAGEVIVPFGDDSVPGAVPPGLTACKLTVSSPGN